VAQDEDEEVPFHTDACLVDVHHRPVVRARVGHEGKSLLTADSTGTISG
jgi:hypothetical protein